MSARRLRSLLSMWITPVYRVLALLSQPRRGRFSVCATSAGAQGASALPAAEPRRHRHVTTSGIPSDSHPGSSKHRAQSPRRSLPPHTRDPCCCRRCSRPSRERLQSTEVQSGEEHSHANASSSRSRPAGAVIFDSDCACGLIVCGYPSAADGRPSGEGKATARTVCPHCIRESEAQRRRT